MSNEQVAAIDIAQAPGYVKDIFTARILSFSCGLAALLVALGLPVSWKIQVITLFLIALAIAYYLRAVKMTVRERFIDPTDEAVNWKLRVKPEALGIPAGDFSRLRHILISTDGPDGPTHESRVRRVSRQHAVFLWLRLLLPLLITAIFLAVSGIVAANGGSIRINTSVHFEHAVNTTTTPKKNQPPTVKPAIPINTIHTPSINWPRSIIISWWLPFSAAILSTLVAWILWLRWKYNFRMITDWSVYLITMPPAWLPFWQPRPRRMSYDEMDTMSPSNSFVGNLIGKLLGEGKSWGTVVLDSPATHDQSFNNIVGQPNHQMFLSDTEAARRSYKQLLSIPGK